MSEKAAVDSQPKDTARIAIAHDWMVTYAGSERVVRELLGAFPGSPVVTTLLKAEALPIELRDARPSVLQGLPGAVNHHEWLLPLMPLAWRLRASLGDVDAVISSSHACAKAVRVQSDIPHLCYCHTPMRYAWDFATERTRFPRPVRPAARLMMSSFRRWDRGHSSRVTRFLANSRAVADRIATHYGRNADVVPPPVDTEFFVPDPVADPRGDTFLYVGRLVSYKRADLAVEAFADLPYKLVVVGEGHLKAELMARATPNVTFLGKVDDIVLRSLYRRARAMVFPADEDFGISMVESMACGTPVVSIRSGGALDIVVPERSGVLAEPDDVHDLRATVRAAAAIEWQHQEIRRHATTFSAGTFRTRMQHAVDDMIRDPRPR